MTIFRYDPPGKVSWRLKSAYGATLFDFAYLLAIALSGEFFLGADIALRSGELRQVRRTLNGLKRSLENAKAKLAKHDCFQELLFHIDGCLRRARKEAYLIHRQRGRIVEERAKLVLLWTQLLVEKREKSLKEPTEVSIGGRTLEFQKKITRGIDWNGYYALFGFFYDRLKDCSYSFYIKPKPDRQREKDYAKSLLEKNSARYERRAYEAISNYELSQGYFRKGRVLPINIGPPRGPKREIYPLIKICFSKDSVETAELRERGAILVRKTKFLDKLKIPCKPEISMEDIQHPMVVFPNGDELVIKDYAPPSFPPPDVQDKLVEDFIAEMQRNVLRRTRKC